MLSRTHFRLAAANGSPRVLITGALGQVGSELAISLRKKYGAENVVMTDIRKPDQKTADAGPFEFCDVLDEGSIDRLVVNNRIDWMIHNSAIMSVLGEAIPHKAMDLNVTGVRNVFEVSRRHNLRTYCPSSMAVFGEDCGKVMTKDDTILNPTTIYGITKVFMEQVGAYYHRKFGVDFRCLRYPGVISAAQLPGGGTTDYAVHMYHYALQKEKFECPVLPHEPLPMMYVDDCIEGTIQFLETPREKLSRCVYNMAGFSFSPQELHDSIQKKIPLEMEYKKGIAQDIAFSWPDSMDDANAQKDWQWKPKYDIDRMTDKMLEMIPIFHNIK